MVCKVRREVVDELQGGFSLRLRDAHDIKADKAKQLRRYADVVTLMRRVEVEVSEVQSSILQIRFPFDCAAYVYLVERDAKNMVHKRVLEQLAHERPFPVFLLDKPVNGGAVVWRQEGGRSLELRGGGAPAGDVDEPPPPRAAEVLPRHRTTTPAAAVRLDLETPDETRLAGLGRPPPSPLPFF